MAEKKPVQQAVPTEAETDAHVDDLVNKALKALEEFEDFTQEQVDYIVAKCSVAGLDHHGILAEAAVKETGRGVFEDKAVKNLFACEYVTNNLRHLKTVGIINEDPLTGITEIAEPVGVVCGIVPTTNPTSTVIFKSLIALKTRNPIIFSFHPSAHESSKQAAIVIRDAAIAAGAPENCIQWLSIKSMYATNALMNHPGVATILATGGIGGIFTSTTNVEYLTGDGLNISLKNNISIKDMEYLQLHPTVLYEPKVKGKKLLLSESLRGEGGIILNQNKEQFIDSLLPRDIVSSAILKEIESTPNKPYVYLDMTKKSKDFLIDRFPFLYNECLKRGYEMDKDLLPIAPAHHYCMGGIKVDLFSKTSMNNLYAVGEVSCTGVHGSNRLASNSLLEALVFGKQAAENINSKINEISFKEIIKEPKSYALDSYEELIKFLKEKVDNRYAKLFNC